MSIYTSIAINLFLMFVVMNLVFWAYKKTTKASWVDTAWAAGIGLVSIGYWGTLYWQNAKTGLLAILMALYSFRLASYLFGRSAKGPEDGRYLSIQKRWASNLDIKFFLFFHFQGVLAVALASPVLVQALSPDVRFGPFQYGALLLFALAIIGEATADMQLKAFKAKAENKGKVCNTGLWAYSRHPNYFFGFIAWCSFALYVLGEPWGFLCLMLPALMLYFYLFVTGIPETEKQALKSRGRLYLEYQLSTSPFVPWFPRKRPGEKMEKEQYV